jgi:hypothetical protein
MLTAVHVERDDDPEDLIIKIYGQSDDPEHRTFWVRGMVLLEKVARVCLEQHMDQMDEDRRKEIAAQTAFDADGCVAF